MTTELIAILAVGVSLAGLILRLNQRIDRLEDRLNAGERNTAERFSMIDNGIAELRERLARLEGLLEGLRDAIGRATAA
ncbi:MAG: hypothetical protein OXQ29_25415 [Rhodospirillaceae bacterium]|nr:hypothetical protein [Rhodospirillaceae bacterium]